MNLPNIPVAIVLIISAALFTVANLQARHLHFKIATTLAVFLTVIAPAAAFRLLVLANRDSVDPAGEASWLVELSVLGGVTLTWIAAVWCGWRLGKPAGKEVAERRYILRVVGALLCLTILLVVGRLCLKAAVSIVDQIVFRRAQAKALASRELEARGCIRQLKVKSGQADAFKAIARGEDYLLAHVRGYQETTTVRVIGVEGYSDVKNHRTFITELPIKEGSLSHVEYRRPPVHTAGADPWRGDAPSTEQCDKMVRSYISDFNRTMIERGSLPRATSSRSTIFKDQTPYSLPVPAYSVPEQALPTQKSANWLSASDYSAATTKEHPRRPVKYHLWIDRRGHIQDCSILVSSGSPFFDKETCAILLRKGISFRAAEEADPSALDRSYVGEYGRNFVN